MRNTISGGDELDGEDGTEKGNSKVKSSDELKGSSEKIIKSLKSIAQEEPVAGKKLAGLAKSQEKIQTGVIGAVEKIEKQGNIKSF